MPIGTGGPLPPSDRVQVKIVGSEAVPLWLGTQDYPWLRGLIDDFVRLDGRPCGEVELFLREPPRVPVHEGKRKMAVSALRSLCTREHPVVDAGELRDAIAVGAQRARNAGRFERTEVLAECARRLGLSAEEAQDNLFADLPAKRRLRIPDPVPDPPSLAMMANQGLAQGLLRLASEVDIDIYGNARAVVRQIRLRRLLCTVRHGAQDGVRLAISGPFSLFRRTTMYGHALVSIIPLLPWCERFDLRAHCMLRGRCLDVHLRPDDPIGVTRALRQFDSRTEERFAREFARVTLDWDLVREPEPIEAGDTLIFPDFSIIHRRDTSRRFLLEIVGFWTPDYLRDKVARLRAMSAVPMVLCIDSELNCSSGDWPGHTHIVWFKKHIDPGAVLAVIEAAYL